ncbi:MAG: hypothetical protein HKP41_07975 [Desulfobacterales bacterium]|nr:hypothetical protein [Desulfobacterales bacterium]
MIHTLLSVPGKRKVLAGVDLLISIRVGDFLAVPRLSQNCSAFSAAMNLLR